MPVYSLFEETDATYPKPRYIHKKGFMTKENLNERRNFRIALAGVLIAFIASLASLIVSIIGMSSRGYYKELQDINNSKQQIRDELHIDETEKSADE